MPQDTLKELGSGHANSHLRELAHRELDKTLDVFDDIRETFGKVVIEVSIHDGYFRQIESTVKNTHK